MHFVPVLKGPGGAWGMVISAQPMWVKFEGALTAQGQGTGTRTVFLN